MTSYSHVPAPAVVSRMLNVEFSGRLHTSCLLGVPVPSSRSIVCQLRRTLWIFLERTTEYFRSTTGAQRGKLPTLGAAPRRSCAVPAEGIEPASNFDKVGYGGGFLGNCPEGTGVAAPAANNSVLRGPAGGCGNWTDTNNNLADFLSQVPSTPRNSSSTPQP